MVALVSGLGCRQSDLVIRTRAQHMVGVRAQELGARTMAKAGVMNQESSQGLDLESAVRARMGSQGVELGKTGAALEQGRSRTGTSRSEALFLSWSFPSTTLICCVSKHHFCENKTKGQIFRWCKWM